MNSNYDWQKHQTSVRIQSRFAEAEIHRSLKQHKVGQRHFYSLGKKVVMLAGGLAELFRRFVSYNRSSKPQSLHNA